MKVEIIVPIDCEIFTCFVGLIQNKTNASLKPEIGWLIRKELENPEKESVFLFFLNLKNMKTKEPTFSIIYDRLNKNFLSKFENKATRYFFISLPQ